MLAKNVLYIYAAFCCAFLSKIIGAKGGGGEISGGENPLRSSEPYSEKKKSNYRKCHNCMIGIHWNVESCVQHTVAS